jgi:hypothetical protein
MKIKRKSQISAHDEARPEKIAARRSVRDLPRLIAHDVLTMNALLEVERDYTREMTAGRSHDGIDRREGALGDHSERRSKMRGPAPFATSARKGVRDRYVLEEVDELLLIATIHRSWRDAWMSLDHRASWPETTNRFPPAHATTDRAGRRSWQHSSHLDAGDSHPSRRPCARVLRRALRPPGDHSAGPEEGGAGRNLRAGTIHR